MTFQFLYIPVSIVYLLSLIAWLQRKRAASLRIFLAAFFLHAGFLTARSFYFGYFHAGGILEEPAFLPFCLAAVLLAMDWSGKKNEALALIPVAASLALIYLVFPKGLIPPSPKSTTLFSSLFFLFEIFAHALFIAAAVLAVRSRKEENFFPSAHQAAVWGFIAYSVAQVTGAIWCYLGWSVTFQWSFRHLHSALTWCLYANYLHLRYLTWWNTRRKAFYLICAALILVIYLAVLQSGEIRQVRIGG